MKREAFINAIKRELHIYGDNAKLLTDFANNNNDLDESEFYEKLKKTFPWLELTFNYNNASTLNKIERHLNFFKVLAIISIILGVIAFIATIG